MNDASKPKPLDIAAIAGVVGGVALFMMAAQLSEYRIYTDSKGVRRAVFKSWRGRTSVVTHEDDDYFYDDIRRDLPAILAAIDREHAEWEAKYLSKGKT